MKNTFEMTEKQIALMNDLRTFFGKKNVVTRRELKVFMIEKKGKKFAADFIVKNEVFKVKDKDGVVDRGVYRLYSTSKSALRKRLTGASAKTVETPAVAAA